MIEGGRHLLAHLLDEENWYFAHMLLFLSPAIVWIELGCVGGELFLQS